MSRERLTAALSAAADQPGGGIWVLEALAGAPGCSWVPEERSALGRVRAAACLTAGQWRFTPVQLSGGIPGVRLTHEVGGIRLAETEEPLGRCADRVARAVCEAASALGSEAERDLLAVLEGLERATAGGASGPA